MPWVIAWLARHPFWIAAAAALISAVALALCFDPVKMRPRLVIDPSIEHLLPAGDADRAVLERVRTTFGDADVVMVAVKFGAVFTPENLANVEELTRRFKQLPGVRGVFSLATAPNLLAVDDAIVLSSFTEQARADPARIAQFPRQLAGNPLYKGSLVSADGDVAAFALALGGVDEQTFLRRDYPALIRAEVRAGAGEVPVWITGVPVVRAAMARALIDTLKFTIPVVFVVILLLQLAAFRSLRAVLMAAVTVGMTLLWTMGAAVLLHIPMNLVTALVPALVITLGLSYTIYLLSAYFSAQGDPSLATTPARARWTMERAGVGLILSAGTTVASFLALLLNVLPAIRQFAVLASIGSALGVLLVLTFLPAALNIVGTRRYFRSQAESLFARCAEALAAFDIRWRVWIIGVALVLIPVDLMFIRNIHAGAEYIKSFDEKAQVRGDFEAINSAFNGANVISILIETHVNDALTDPALVREVESLEDWLRTQPEVGAALSYVDHLKLINRGLNGNDPEYYRVPDSAAAVKQLLVFGGSEEIRRVIDSRFRSALVNVRINVDGSIPIAGLVRRLENRLKQLPPPLNAQVTGSPVLATRTVNEIAAGQFQSIAIASVAIWLLLAFMFTSLRAGLIALLPTVVPVVIYFGTLGLLDISLSPTTSLIACIVIGIAVDDTIQFLARFNADARATGSETAAVKSALRTVLRPVTLSTAALCLGFLVFTGSELRNQAQFGVLAAFTLAMAWIMNITLTPALGSKLRIVTFWDLLRLDLGQNPQHTIPLFAGLSLREARIFALLSHLESVPAGARVIQEGDWARDVYVVVDGELSAWIEREGQQRMLSTMTRGAVLGETGFFGQRRTANVDTRTPARLLRFDSEDLEQLRTRYPRIAATIFRNLNRIQAERLARTTAMVQ